MPTTPPRKNTHSTINNTWLAPDTTHGPTKSAGESPDTASASLSLANSRTPPLAAAIPWPDHIATSTRRAPVRAASAIERRLHPFESVADLGLGRIREHIVIEAPAQRHQHIADRLRGSQGPQSRVIAADADTDKARPPHRHFAHHLRRSTTAPGAPTVSPTSVMLTHPGSVRPEENTGERRPSAIRENPAEIATGRVHAPPNRGQTDVDAAASFAGRSRCTPTWVRARDPTAHSPTHVLPRCSASR